MHESPTPDTQFAPMIALPAPHTSLQMTPTLPPSMCPAYPLCTYHQPAMNVHASDSPPESPSVHQTARSAVWCSKKNLIRFLKNQKVNFNHSNSQGSFSRPISSYASTTANSIELKSVHSTPSTVTATARCRHDQVAFRALNSRCAPPSRRIFTIFGSVSPQAQQSWT